MSELEDVDAAGGHDAAVAARASSNLLAVTVPARRDAVGPLRRAVAAFASVHGASEVVQANMALAVSEAVTNAVLHGYAADGRGQIHVIADYEDGAIEVVVADDGRGLRADVRSEGLGLGLGLIARCASRFTARDRDPHGTEIWMRFEL